MTGVPVGAAVAVGVLGFVLGTFYGRGSGRRRYRRRLRDTLDVLEQIARETEGPHRRGQMAVVDYLREEFDK